MIARGTSWRCLAIVLFCIVIQGSVVQRVTAQSATDQRQPYLLGTGSTGGTYHPVGVALSTLIKLKLLPYSNVDLTAVNTRGSHENVELLRQNKLQFAILSALASHEARTGTGAFAEVGPDKNLRAIATLWLSTNHVIIHKDDVQSGKIDDFFNLRGRKVSLGRQNSGTLLENRMLMAGLGVDIDSTFDLVEMDYGESAQALITGEIDGMSLSGGLPVAAVQETFDALGQNAVVLEFSDEQLNLLDRGRGLWTRAVIPAGTYPGQDQDLLTIGSPKLLAVRADIDEEAVYQITRTIFEELDYLHGLHGATGQISLANAVTNLPLPIHEGAIRYYRERGVTLPPPPVELDPNLLASYDSVDQARAEVNRGVVTLFSGTNGDTSARVFAELASVLNTRDDDVRLLPTQGGGGAQNLTDLLYLKGVDATFMQADVLAYARQNPYPGIKNQITYITEMFPEEVHLVVRDDITGIRGLVGKRVNIGSPGSGTEITASIILSQLGLPIEPTRYDPYVALDRLKRGDIDGALFVGGKPMPLLQEIERDSGLTLLPIPFTQYQDGYRPAEITAADYPNLVAPDAPVTSLAVRTALVTYAWRPDTPRYRTLTSFTNALFARLADLHDSGRHPKWREVDPTAQFSDWHRFEPARVWIDDNPGTAQRIALDGRQLKQRDDNVAAAPQEVAIGDQEQRQAADEEDPQLAPPSLDAAVTAPDPPSAPAAPAVAVPAAADPRPTTDAAPAEPTVQIAPALGPSIETPPLINGANAAEPAPSNADRQQQSVNGHNRPAAATTTANTPTF